MPYGTLKVDNIIFTNGGVDQTITVSGIVASTSGNLTATGTISGNIIRGGTTVSGATVTGSAGQFGNLTAVSGTFTTISGGTYTLTSGVFASGTAANPSISFVSDPNTGIYSPGADQVAISTSGTGRLFVDSSGRVGLGIASPTAALSVVSQTNTTWFSFRATSAGFDYGTFLNSGASVIGYMGAGGSATTAGTSADLAIRAEANLLFAAGGNTERMRIDSSGRLLVGTSSAPGPVGESAATGSSPQLYLQGTAAITDAPIIGCVSTFSGTYGARLALGHSRSGAILSSGDQLGRIQFAGHDGTDYDSAGAWITAEVDGTPGSNDMPGRLVFSTTADGANTPTERMRITSAGLVGLGTSSPGAGIHIATAGQTTSALDTAGNINLLVTDTGASAGNGGSVVFGFNSGAGRFASIKGQVITGAGNSTGHLTFSTRNATSDAALTERLRITNDGLVGIGTTSPLFPLDVNGVIYTRGRGSTFGVLFDDWRIYNSTAPAALVFDNGSERARIDSSGRLLVGTSTARSNFYNTSFTPQVQVEGASDATSYQSLVCGLASIAGAGLILGHQRSGTVGGNTVLQSGDQLGIVSFQGSDGSELVAGAYIEAYVDGTPGANDMPGRLVFSTTADGASSPTERMRITSAGNVGIGTTSPTAKLEVAGGNIRLDNNQGVEWGGVNNYIYGNESTDFIAIATNGNERSRWDSSGRLLVGTSSARSNVNGGTPTTQIETAVGSVSTGLSVINNSSSGFTARLALGLTKGNSVGSVTSVANSDVLGYLSYVGADGTNLIEAARIETQVDGTPGTNDMPGRLVFSTTADGASSPTERMRITQNGDLLLNATAVAGVAVAKSYMYLSGGANTNTSTYATQHATLHVRYQPSSNNEGAANALVLQLENMAGTIKPQLLRGYNSSDGLVLNADYRGALTNFGNSYGAISDLKLKTEIVDAASAWQDIKAVKVRKYKIKTEVQELGDNAESYLGVVAQELESSCPGLVVTPADYSETNDENKSVKYSVLYMKAVKALQEAMERIETLEAKVAALEAA